MLFQKKNKNIEVLIYLKGDKKPSASLIFETKEQVNERFLKKLISDDYVIDVGGFVFNKREFKKAVINY